VFRDQESARHAFAPGRAHPEMRGLRSGQFAEDAGPMAHPVRPAPYMEIKISTPATVYEKGAEGGADDPHLDRRERVPQRGWTCIFRAPRRQAVTCDDSCARWPMLGRRFVAVYGLWYDPG